MPTIATASIPITTYANIYVSPYGNDGVIPLYSSVPITNRTTGNCLPCVLCGNSSVRQDVIQTEAQASQTNNT